jgi:hypothetical protein
MIGQYHADTSFYQSSENDISVQTGKGTASYYYCQNAAM